MAHGQQTQKGSRSGKRRTTLLWIGMLIILYACIEGVSFAALRLLRIKGVPETSVNHLNAQQRTNLLKFAEDDPRSFFAFSSTLGWVHRPGAKSRGGREIINAQGLRATREFPVTAPDQLRIAAFGDSFTYGDEVANPETWEELMMVLEPAWAVLNAGVAGYGVDQALLRYEQMGPALKAHIVLIGFMTENINRSVNVYRPFLNRGSAMISKPRFVIDHGQLILVPNLMQKPDDLRALANDDRAMLAKLGTRDYFYQKRFYTEGLLDVLPSVHLARVVTSQIKERFLDEPIISGWQFNDRSEAYRVSKAIIERFYDEVLRKGSVPVVVLFPDRETIHIYRRNGHRVYQPLKDDLKRNALLTLDLLDALNTAPSIGTLFGNYHYSGYGNGIVAQQITAYIREHHLDDPNVRANILSGRYKPQMTMRAR